MTVYIDSSVLVAGVSLVHTRHPECLVWLDDIVEGRVNAICHGHMVLEAYSVLTGSPVPLKTSPANAQAVIDHYLQSIELVEDSPFQFEVVQSAVERSVTGGTIHDLRHVLVAEQKDVDRVLTLNEKHFRRLWRGRGDVVIGV